MSHVRHFIVDECDKCLESIDMRADVQVGPGRLPWPTVGWGCRGQGKGCHKHLVSADRRASVHACKVRGICLGRFWGVLDAT